MSPRDFDIIVVGAGIAGSATAIALARSQLRVALLEARPLQRTPLPVEIGVTAFDQRVSALTPASVRFLEQLGAWADIRNYRSCAYRHMTVWDAEGTAEIEFDCAELQAPALGYIVENRAIVDALLGALEAASGVECLSPRRLASFARGEQGDVRVTLESGEVLRAPLLVGADGALSVVRKQCGFATREWDYGHHAIVATIQTENSHADTAWQRFLPSGPLALLPMPGSPDAHFCSIVWSLDSPLAEPLLQASEEEFCTALTRASEARLGRVVAVGPRAGFPLRQRHATDYIQPGVALVGDAAHTIHPLAGQGINLGLADVAALAAEIERGLAQGLPPGRTEVLARYQRQRKGENLLMMGAMEGFKRLFEQQSLPLRWLRNAGMRRVASAAPLKRRLMKHAMGMS